MISVPVAVAGRPYEVMIGENLIDRAGALIAPLLKRAEKFAVRPMVEPKPLKARKDPLDIR